MQDFDYLMFGDADKTALRFLVLLKAHLGGAVV